jgi:hypothetical protein
MHTCDNRACIEPTHLKKGNRKENMQDAYNKGKLNKNNSPSFPMNSKQRARFNKWQRAYRARRWW